MTGACVLCVLYLRHCSAAGLRVLREAFLLRDLILSRRAWEESSASVLCV